MKKYNVVPYISIFVFFFSCFAIVSTGRFGGDGVENYLTAKSIVLDGDIAIDNNYRDIKEIQDRAEGVQGRAGLHYSSFGIGMPILLIPLYVTGLLVSKCVPSVCPEHVTQFFTSFTNPVLVALTAVALFYLLLKMRFGPAVSFATIICYGFSTMSLIYTRSGFSEPAIGLSLILAVLLIWRYEESGNVGNMAAVSILAGYAVLIKSNSLLYLPLLAGYVIYKSFKGGISSDKVRLWLAAFIPVAAFMLIYFYLRSIMNYGSDVEGVKIYNDIVARSMPQKPQFIKGIIYYLFSAGKGYFFYNLPLVLGLFALHAERKERKQLHLFIMIIVLLNLFYYSARFFRGSIFSWGPRYLYPTIPLMCVFLAGFIENARSWIKKTAVKFFIAAGFLVQLPCMAVNFGKYIMFVKEQLGLPEYMINYVPSLSPIAGVWRMFISAVQREFSGSSLNFVYNPDALLIAPLVRSLKGYDGWDIWWYNAVSLYPAMRIVCAVAVVILVLMAISSFALVRWAIGSEKR